MKGSLVLIFGLVAWIVIGVVFSYVLGSKEANEKVRANIFIASCGVTASAYFAVPILLHLLGLAQSWEPKIIFLLSYSGVVIVMIMAMFLAMMEIKRRVLLVRRF